MAQKPSLQEIIQLIGAAPHPTGMRTKIVAVDGLGGAGKSTLAEIVADALGRAPIIHTDDFASWDNPLSWWPRLVDQVLKPLSVNQPAHYQRYDWDAKSMAEWHDVEPGEYLIIEGVSSSRTAFRPYLAFSIWVETPRKERLRRGLERDGQDALELWNGWMAQEDDYAEREQPAKHADIVISGADF
jgi:uridine kinase